MAFGVRRLRRCLLTAVLLGAALTASASEAPKRVLIIHSFGPEFGDFAAKALRSELDRQLPGRIELYESWLVSARFATSDEDPAFASYLKALFEDRALDLIITFGAPAANFLQIHRQSMFPQVPALLADVEERRVPPSSFTSNDTAVAIAVDFPAIVDHIQHLLPNTRNLAVIIGNSPIEKFWVGAIGRSLQVYRDRINLIWLNEMSFDELLVRVGNLPPGSAIFYVVLSPEVVGMPPDEDQALAKLHAAANAPMFSYTDAYLGKGIVGGPLISSEEQSRKIVNLAVRILTGEPAASLRIAPVHFASPRYDARELDRWRIKQSALPPASTVLFREPSVWARYAWQITAAGILFLVESALIIRLLYERRGRQSAEIESHQRMAELAHMNRRATVGELSGAIAHELNQPLGAILRNSEAAELMLDSGAPDMAELKEIIRDIKNDDERAGEVIRRLRRMLAKAPLEQQEVDLNSVVNEVFAFLSAQALARGVTLSTRLTSPSPSVSGDRIQLQQVILNLVMNAMDALGTGGGRERTVIGQTALVAGGLAEVSILDFGSGLPPDKTKQIFQPFFTTKVSGMGMGLSIARTIIERHGGRIWAENRPTGGAAFRFTLPLLKGRKAPGTLDVAASASPGAALTPPANESQLG